MGVGVVMGRTRAGDLGRRQLIEAAAQTIYEHGYQEATVARIAEASGLSAGNIHYHFGGKDGLLEATMRALLGDIHEAMIEQLSRAASPLERVRAVIRTNLAEPLFRPEICRVWLHFWAQTAHQPRLARLERINATRFRANLQEGLRHLVPQPAVAGLAREIVAMVNGLWMARAQRNSTLDAESASRRVFRYLDRRLRDLA